MTKGFLKDMTKYLLAQVIMGMIGFISIPIIIRSFFSNSLGYPFLKGVHFFHSL